LIAVTLARRLPRFELCIVFTVETRGERKANSPVLDKDRLAGLVSIGTALRWQIETIRERIHQLELAIAELNLMRL